MSMKIITFFENSLRETMFSFLESIFTVNIFAWMEGIKKIHTFLSHYQMGGRQPVEDKPLKKTFFDENLQRYCVSFIEHGTHYNFYNSRELVSDFFDTLKICLFQELTLGRSASNVPLEMWIANLPPGLGLLKLPTAEFAQTNVYDGVYFNFIKFKLVSTRHFEKGYYEWHDWWQLET